MESKLNMFEDFMNVQKEIDALKKKEDNPFFKSKYVPLNQVLSIVKPVLHSNNFVLVQEPFVAEGESCLRTRVIHKSGEEFTGAIKLVAKDTSDPQKIGGSLTYMRRYSLCSMLGLEEEDDDGNEASKKPPEKPKKSVFQQAKEALRGATSLVRYDEAWGNVKARKKEFAVEDWAELEIIGGEEKSKHVSGTK